MSGARSDKWRPTMLMIVIATMGTVLTLPLAGIGFIGLIENSLIKSTENALIVQSAALASTFRDKLRSSNGTIPLGQKVSVEIGETESQQWRPITPELDLNLSTVLGKRGDALPAKQPVHETYSRVGEAMNPILLETQATTLAGFRLLDFNGTVIAGRAEIGLSFGHLPEIKKGLLGEYSSVLRQREVQSLQPIYSIRRGSKVRVMTAFPIILDQRVAGLVYASRTPSNILKEFYIQRKRLLWTGAVVVLIALCIGWVFARAILRPIKELTRRTQRISTGDRDAIRQLDHHGTREIHALSNGFLDMSRKLLDRNAYINTFATHVSHELKSPLTSIRGAIELLSDPDTKMTPKQQSDFMQNIAEDTERMTVLLDRLRTIARADNMAVGGQCALQDVIASFDKCCEGVHIDLVAPAILPMSEESAHIVFQNLISNALNHGASNIRISPKEASDRLTVTVTDDGTGISTGNRAKIFDMFFTTRRKVGGTGLGLEIVRSLITAHGGNITLNESNSQTEFRLEFPRI